MKIYLKLVMAVISVLVLETATLEYTYLRSAREIARRVKSMQMDAQESLVHVIRMERALSELQTSVVDAVLDDNVSERESRVIAERAADFTRQIAVYDGQMTIAVQPEMQRILRQAGALGDQMSRETEATDTATREAAQLIVGISGIVSRVQRRERVAARTAYDTDVLPHLVPIRASFDILADLQHEQGRYVVAQLTDVQRTESRQFAATAVATIVLAAIAMVSIARALVKPVNALIAATERITQGNLETQIDVSSRDEVGALAASFQSMTARLRQSQREIAEHTRLLQDSQRSLADAQHLAHLGSWTWDVRTNAVTWSDEQFRILGLEPASLEPTFETYLSFVHPDEQSSMTQAISEALKSKRPLEYEQRIVRRDGIIRVVHARGDVVTDGDGAPVRIVVTGQDVTERAEVEQALRTSEERFQLAMLATNDALWDRAPGSRDIWWSDGFFRLFGYAPGAIAHTLEAWSELIHPDDRAYVRGTIEEFLASDRVVWTSEYRFRRSGGVYAWVFDRGYAVREGGTARRMIGSMMDITSRKEAERMKSDFVSFVSHQLRTPLSGMNWMLELASDTPDLPDLARDYISEARASAERLGGLVNDLLDVSRLESGRLALAIEPVDLAALTRSLVDETRALVDAKGHHIVLDVADALPSVAADAQLLRQAIANLVSNAIKYTPPGGAINFALDPDNGRVRWTVKDSGIGIPKAAQARLFEKFYRADNAVAMETEGTGLGLHLVRLVIEQFGGTVWCESEEGIGSTFGVTLPAVEAA